MLIDRTRDFTASEAGVSQTGGNVHILHLELDYFLLHLGFFCKKSFLGTLISLKRVKSQCFDIAVSSYRQEVLLSHYPLQNNDLIYK